MKNSADVTELLVEKCHALPSSAMQSHEANEESSMKNSPINTDL